MKMCAGCGKQAERLTYFLAAPTQNVDGTPVYDALIDICEDCANGLQDKQETDEQVLTVRNSRCAVTRPSDSIEEE